MDYPVFSTQDSVDAWQAYATLHNITIIGSASPVSWSPGSVTGVWIVLAPGGTAPKITDVPPNP